MENKTKVIEWIKEQMNINGGDIAVIGISGGKDSSVVATLCVEALGKENVIGVLMPNGEQKDIQYSYDLVNFLDIKHYVVNIKESVDIQTKLLKDSMNSEMSYQAKTNLPARIRMMTLFGIAQNISDKTRIINTSNLSEDWVGYATLHGDAIGAFSPLGMMTTEEVIELGRELNLPEKFLVKTPEDGLSGKTDEDNFGFTYEILNKYIRTGICEDEEIKTKIDKMYNLSRFKFKLMPMFDNDKPICNDSAKTYR